MILRGCGEPFGDLSDARPGRRFCSDRRRYRGLRSATVRRGPWGREKSRRYYQANRERYDRAGERAGEGEADSSGLVLVFPDGPRTSSRLKLCSQAKVRPTTKR